MSRSTEKKPIKGSKKKPEKGSKYPTGWKGPKGDI